MSPNDKAIALALRLAGALRAHNPASPTIASIILNAAGELGSDSTRAISILDELSRSLEAPDRECHRCGCTDASPCAGGCAWVSATLCSTCMPAELAELQAIADERAPERDLAAELYAAYNAAGDPSTAGKTWDGRACPTWDGLTDNVREKWRAAARHATARPRLTVAGPWCDRKAARVDCDCPRCGILHADGRPCDRCAGHFGPHSWVFGEPPCLTAR